LEFLIIFFFLSNSFYFSFKSRRNLIIASSNSIFYFFKIVILLIFSVFNYIFFFSISFRSHFFILLNFRFIVWYFCLYLFFNCVTFQSYFYFYFRSALAFSSNFDILILRYFSSSCRYCYIFLFAALNLRIFFSKFWSLFQRSLIILNISACSRNTLIKLRIILFII
jgi:hypothetical protein